MRLRILPSIAAIATAVMLMSAMPSEAQIPAPDVAQAPEFDEAEIQSFATAVKEVQRIADAYTPATAAALTSEERDRVESTASDEMEAAVAEEGLTIPRFRQILSRARVDSSLAERIEGYLQ